MNYRTKQKIKKRLPAFLVKKIKQIGDLFDRRPKIVYNIGYDVKKKYRILLCYVPNFLFAGELNSLIGTREKECSIFVNALLSKSCIVDICYVDYKGPFKDNYDYIIGQGPAFRLARTSNPQAKSVLYLTEMPPYYSFEKERERAEYLYKRHKIKVNIERSGKYFIDEDLHGLEACIMMGRNGDEKYISGTRTYMIQPTGLNNSKFQIDNRNVDKSKYNYIWIGSFGAVHKGLDILFDVFAKHPELTLHVLGLQPQERQLLKKIIPSNVVDYGFIQISSDEFVEIANKCAFMIYPSCSEGVATSVITAMNHGIIPLVSEVCSIEAEECGEVMSSYLVEDVEKVVLKWHKISNEEILEKMKESIKVANEWYTTEKYSETLHKILYKILCD